MLKKLASMLLALLVSVSGRTESQEQYLSEDEMNVFEKIKLILQRKGKADGGTCKDTETAWERFKRKADESAEALVLVLIASMAIIGKLVPESQHTLVFILWLIAGLTVFWEGTKSA
ncbi:MAG: hypothetical protein LBS61_00785 [Endomicrobium sp.]|jgi:hypothetical protein|nr:hypothetical protein [Endomicrobium sp.]